MDRKDRIAKSIARHKAKEIAQHLKKKGFPVNIRWYVNTHYEQYLVPAIALVQGLEDSAHRHNPVKSFFWEKFSLLFT